MERTFNKAEDLADHIKEYVNARIDSIKLSVAEKVSAVLANILAGLVVAFVFLLFVMYLFDFLHISFQLFHKE